MTMLTRRYHFSASHRLHSAELSPAENQRLYGKCNHQFGHGHDYVLEVSVTGEPDAETGLIVPLHELDRLVNDRVLQLFASRYINKDVAEFASLVPTTENIVMVVSELLQTHWGEYIAHPRAWLCRVHIQETENNQFELIVSAPGSNRVNEERYEGILVA